MQKFPEDIMVSDDLITDLEKIASKAYDATDTLARNIKHKLIQYEFLLIIPCKSKRGKRHNFGYSMLINLRYFKKGLILHRAMKCNNPELFGLHMQKFPENIYVNGNITTDLENITA